MLCLGSIFVVSSDACEFTPSLRKITHKTALNHVAVIIVFSARLMKRILLIFRDIIIAIAMKIRRHKTVSEIGEIFKVSLKELHGTCHAMPTPLQRIRFIS
jgi:hypothetical protein